MKRTVLAGCLILLAATLSCSVEEVPTTPPAAEVPAARPPGPEPDHIKVQHILIAFDGAVGFEGRGGTPAKARGRTREQAAKLAGELLARARKGEDFDALVRQHTDDAHPGIYGMANHGKPPRPGDSPRSRMVPAFGDTGFPLAVGEIGMAAYDTTKSPFGWHIVKRLE